MANKRKKITVELDETTLILLQERIEYLQSKRLGCKVTVSDAVRHALSNTSYKRAKKNSDTE